MKTPLTIIILFIALSHFVLAQNLPEEAKRILDKLAQYENDEHKKAEQEIIKIKQSLIRDLERSARGIKSEDILKLYKFQINKLNEEVENSEKLIKGEGKFEDIIGDEDVFRDEDNHERRGHKELVLFDVAYYYNHPLKDFADQIGELVFFRDNRVKVTHKKDNGEIHFEHIVSWEERKGKIIIRDEVHGDFIIRRRDGGGIKELDMRWTRLDKTIPLTAK